MIDPLGEPSSGLRRERRPTAARHHLTAAAECFGWLRATPWTDRALREVRASGGLVSTPRSTTLRELTPQEEAVARLVACGATNKEAAQQLVLSPKTIAFHLGNVYRKLGVRSRTELAVSMARAPGGFVDSDS